MDPGLLENNDQRGMSHLLCCSYPPGSAAAMVGIPVQEEKWRTLLPNSHAGGEMRPPEGERKKCSSTEATVGDQGLKTTATQTAVKGTQSL